MSRQCIWRVAQVSHLVAFAAAVAILAGPALAQEKPSAQKAKKPSVHMPIYYGQVIDPPQREKITAILVEFSPKINALKTQLEALTKERDEKVAAVLTPEQAKKVEQLKAAARAKRRAAKEAKAQETVAEKEVAPAKESNGRKKPGKKTAQTGQS